MMAHTVCLLTTIRGSELRERPVKCSVRESGDSPRKKRDYSNQTFRIDLLMFVEPIFAAILWKLLNDSKRFCGNFTIWLYKQWISKSPNVGTTTNKVMYRFNDCLSLSMPNSNENSVKMSSCLKIKLSIHLIPLRYLNMTADIRWSKKLWPLLVEFAQLNDVMSWLSTLGGAYSSLGENCVISSKKAGEISKQQYVIASKMRNPILTAHCNLFLAMSLVQRGYLKSATIIIRKQYHEAKSNGFCDPKLISLCKAVWNKVKFKKQLKAKTSRDAIPHINFFKF